MKKLFFVFVSLAFGSVITNAQLSDRVNSPSTFKLGTRPVAGNLGVFFGAGYQDFSDIINRIDQDDSTEVKNVLPLIAIKLYKSDNVVLRIGIHSKEKNLSINGTLVVDTANNWTELKYQRKKNEFFITPGIEYHFSTSNIFDVYLGAVIPVGYYKENNTDYVKGTSDYNGYIRSRFALAYGLEGFIGIQAFIADLPLAIGLEVGTSALGATGKKWKVKHSSKIGNIVNDKTYYSLNLSATDEIDPLSVPGQYAKVAKFDKLNAKGFKTEGMARLTISYYFAK